MTKIETTSQLRAAALRLPLVSPQDVTILNIWYGRCPPLAFGGFEQPLTLTPRFWPHDTSKEALAALPLTIAGLHAQVIFPHDLAANLIEPCGVDYSSLSPQSASLLLEYRFSGLLDRLEAFLGESVSLDAFVPVQHGSWRENPVRLNALCEYGQAKYRVTFLVPQPLALRFAEKLMDTSPPREKAAVNSAPVNLSIRAGYTTLTFKELRTIGLGDVLLANSPLGKTEMMAVIGERHAARARWEDGKVFLLESPSPLGEEQRKVWSMTDSLNRNNAIEALDGDVDDVLVHVTFEVGRKEIELRELRSLAEGHVFDCGRDPRVGVDILAGSRRIGQGELILINETLGIRVTRLFNHE